MPYLYAEEEIFPRCVLETRSLFTSVRMTFTTERSEEDIAFVSLWVSQGLIHLTGACLSVWRRLLPGTSPHKDDISLQENNPSAV